MLQERADGVSRPDAAIFEMAGRSAEGRPCHDTGICHFSTSYGSVCSASSHLIERRTPGEDVHQVVRIEEVHGNSCAWKGLRAARDRSRFVAGFELLVPPRRNPVRARHWFPSTAPPARRGTDPERDEKPPLLH